MSAAVSVPRVSAADAAQEHSGAHAPHSTVGRFLAERGCHLGDAFGP